MAYKPYQQVDGPWIELGVTPLDKVRVPVGMHRWKIQKEGYQERELASCVLGRNALGPEQQKFVKDLDADPLIFQWDLREKGRVPAERLAVTPGEGPIERLVTQYRPWIL